MIGIIDVDGKLPNIALMKISSYYKNLGEKVEFVRPGYKYDKIYASAIFTRSKHECEKLIEVYGDTVEIGGTGWDIDKTLPQEIETCKIDYDLYTTEDIYKRICRGIGKKENKLKKAAQIVNAGIGFTSRGCIRDCCEFCFVPKKEGKFRQAAEIKDLINSRSNVLILHDNNFTADPLMIEKCKEIKERNLIVDINQGCDVRLMTEEKARSLSEIKHLRSIHYAWDLMEFESQVMQGIKTLIRFIKTYRHMCFMLVGYNTTFEEDVYRFEKLREMKIDPFVMIYNQLNDKKLKHFARWVNSRIYKKCKWEEYWPWVRDQVIINQISLFD